MNPTSPYKGLQPYQEQDRDNFFGRDVESRLLIGKFLTHKLSLLFAASGVGKSSLLQAAVIPELKQRGLDVVYHNDWVLQPLENLQHNIIKTLREKQKISTDFEFESDLALDEFLQLCSAFSSDPLIIILDQFEEFFNYHRFQEDFRPFIDQLATALHDNTTRVLFVFSMREDFALELNAFKPRLPALLFDNFYRLEKLNHDNAAAAMQQPLKPFGFAFEQGLLPQMLKDLSEREQIDRYGLTEALRGKLPALVEPPHLQIVCMQLWEIDKQRTDKCITRHSYLQKGGAQGLLKNYFTDIVQALSANEKKLASKAFDLLVNKHGTKSAHALPELAQILHLDQSELGQTLDKLEHARILRRQQRHLIGQTQHSELWYELYHDVFAKSIYNWNETYKSQQRRKKASLASLALIGFVSVCAVAYDVYLHYNHVHVRLSPQVGVSDTVELWQGQAEPTLGWVKKPQFISETAYVRADLAPDRLFAKQDLLAHASLNIELIERLPLQTRVQGFVDGGLLDHSHRLLCRSLNPNSNDRQIELSLHGFNQIHTKQSQVQLFALSQQITHPRLQPKLETALNTMVMPPSVWQSYLDSGDSNKGLWAVAQAQTWGGSSLFQQGLNHGDEKVRLQAAIALGRLGDKIAVTALLDALKDTEWSVRRSAADALGRLGDETTVTALLDALKDTDRDVRSSAADALGNLGDKTAVTALLETLKDNEESVRSSAAEALGSLNDKTAVPALLDALKDTEWSVRSRAADALGRLGDKTVMPILINAFRDNNSGIDNEDIAILLGKLGDNTAVLTLLDALKGNDSDVRQSAAKALGRLGNKTAIPTLLKALEDNKMSVRSNAAAALGKLGDETEIPSLLNNLFKENDRYTIDSIVNSLGNLGDENIIPMLLDLFKEDVHHYIRSSAAKILGSLGNKTAVPALLNALKDNKKTVRDSVATALGNLGDKTDVFTLRDALKDTGNSLSPSMVESLGKLGDKIAIPALLNALKDTHTYSRSDVAAALGRLRDKTAVPALLNALKDNESDVRRNVAIALGKLDDKTVVPMLLTILKKNDGNNTIIWGKNIRNNVAEALGKLDDKTAVPTLLSLLEASNVHSDVRGSAIFSLGRLGDKIAVPALLNALKDSDDNIRINAVAALGNMGEKTAVLALKDAFKDTDIDIRRMAIYALIQLGEYKHLFAALTDSINAIRQAALLGLAQAGSQTALQTWFTVIQQPHLRVSTSQQTKIHQELKQKQVNKDIWQTFFKQQQQTKHIVKLNILNNLNGHNIRYGNVIKIRVHPVILTAFSIWLNDEDYRVREKLLDLLEENLPNKYNPQMADLIPALEHILNKKEEALALRLSAWRVLQRLPSQHPLVKHLPADTNSVFVTYLIRTEKATDPMALLALEQQENDNYTSTTFFNIVGLWALESQKYLTSEQHKKLREYLHQRLSDLTQQKQQWRKRRDQQQSAIQTDDDIACNINQQQDNPDDAWHYGQQLFELGRSLVFLEPELAVDLLVHEIRQVRRGAQQAVRELNHVPLLKTLEKRLYQAQQQGKAIQHRSLYYAINTSLEYLSWHGEAVHLSQLQDWQPQHDTIKQRLEWTQEWLAFRLQQLAKSQDAYAHRATF